MVRPDCAERGTFNQNKIDSIVELCSGFCWFYFSILWHFFNLPKEFYHECKNLARLWSEFGCRFGHVRLRQQIGSKTC
jgi:hypothetical protein